MTTSIWYILVLLICVENVLNKKKLYGTFDRIEVCGKPPNPKIKWENFTISVVNDNWTCSSDLEVFGDPISRIEVSVNFQRCSSREALDSCQDYHTLTTANGCQLLSLDNMLWSPYMKAIKPQITCPLKSGKYKQTNGWFDTKSFQMFPLEKYYWKVTITLSSHWIHMVTFCMDGMVYRKNI